MSSISLGWFFHIIYLTRLIMKHSFFLANFMLLVMHSSNPTVQWLANTLLFRAPVTIMVGCRLIISIRRATSLLQSDSSYFNFVESTVVFGDRSNFSHP